MPGTSYVGKAGQLATMSEFLMRGYNVAVPEVDVGDDVFVVHDREGILFRIQVKTATAVRRGYGHSGVFSVPLDQLREPTQPDLDYAFALRKGVGQWEFLIAPRKQLNLQHRRYNIGKVINGKLILYISFRETEVLCSGRSCQHYRNNWDRWPVIAGK